MLEEARSLHSRGSPPEAVLSAYDTAIARLGRSKRQSQQSLLAVAHVNRAGVLTDMGADAEDVLLAYGRAVALEPRMPTGHIGRAAMMQKLGRETTEVLWAWEQAVAVEPQNGDSHYRHGTQLGLGLCACVRAGGR